MTADFGWATGMAGRKVIVFFLTVEIIIINYTEGNDHDLHI